MFPPSRASRARKGTITVSHSDPFALCAVISWTALASAGSVSRTSSRLRRRVKAKSASDSCRASAAAAALSSFSRLFANLPQQIQPVRDDSAANGFPLDLKLVTIGLSKSRQLIVGDSEHFPQYSHDFVARIRIDHDREQRRKPRVRRMLGLTITFGLNFDRNLLLEQRIADCP